MRELNLYQTEEDELHLIAEALAVGCRLIPDQNYETAEVTFVDTMEAFQFFRSTQRHFFLLHESFQKSPVVLRKISKEGNVFYYVSPSQGGPFLEFMGGGVFESKESGAKHIRSGFLACRPEYWDEGLTIKQAAPPELARMYEKLSKIIRTNSTRIKPDKAVYWLGNDANAQLLNGMKLGLHQQWQPD